MSNSDFLNTDWRKVASTIYRKPVDSKIFGQGEFDVTEVEKFITAQRKKGLKITMTHFVLLMVARGIKKEVPQLNAYVRRGKLVGRPTIDATVSVLLSKDQMGSVKIDNAAELTLAEAVDALTEEINKSRKGSESKAMQSKNFLSSIPWPLRGWVYRLYKMFTIDWGINLPFLGLNTDSFGTFLLTNIGTLGLDSGFPAMLPSSNVSFVMLMGGVKKKPVVVDDEIVIRRIMPLTVVMDHRVADASHAGKILRYMKYILKRPEELLEK